MRCTSQSPTIVASVANRRNCSSGLMPSRDCSHSIMGGQARDRGCGAPDAPALDYSPTVPSDHGEPMRSLALLVVGCVAAARVSAQQAATLRIGSAAARPGEKGSGFVDVPAGVDSGTRVPLTIVRGKDPGPTLALIAGTHGDEVAPVIALQRVRRELDPVRLAGTVLLVHVANLPSFLRRTIYYSPIDGKNLNRVYPGKRDGTVSERIADAITREIIERADYLVDIHAGDGNESLRPYTYWSPLGLNARADSIARQMALAWGNDYIVIDTARPHDLRASVYTQNTAHLRGKPALTTEAGYLGVPAEDMVTRNVQGVFRLLRYLKMLPGEVELVRHPLWFDRSEVLRSPGTGIWYPLVERGHAVQKGAVIGVVTDFFGDTTAAIAAPFAGVMLYVVATPAISAGEPLGMVGHPVEER
ncbi:MAG: succinylglutamate desuccinylase [Gemmatimonadetes bacterium]|nr:MAG: succinylglutamate desuccinylase [Gemmatimonadota bacterium]PYP28372.1 MAG: succinylglutamate desuccinylase [Gemmatimonadota bacterium]